MSTQTALSFRKNALIARKTSTASLNAHTHTYNKWWWEYNKGKVPVTDKPWCCSDSKIWAVGHCCAVSLCSLRHWSCWVPHLALAWAVQLLQLLITEAFVNTPITLYICSIFIYADWLLSWTALMQMLDCTIQIFCSDVCTRPHSNTMNSKLISYKALADERWSKGENS